MTRDAVYCFDRACVLFAIYPEGPRGPRIIAEISENALRGVFGACGDGESLVETCRVHFDPISEAALQRFHHDSKKAVQLEAADFALDSALPG